MFLPKKMKKVARIVSLMALPFTASALDFSLIPIMPGTITNVQLSHYDIGGTGTGAPMFKLIIDNAGDTAHTGMIVVYTIEVASSALSSKPEVVYKGATDPFTIAAGARYEVLSNDFLNENSTNPIHQKNRIQKMENKALEEKVLAAGKVPTGDLKVTLYLAKGTTFSHTMVGSEEVVEAEIVNVSQLDLITPGMSTDNLNEGVDEIQTPSPRFSWISDLRANMYDECTRCYDKNVFELELYERKAGQSKNEVLASPAIFIQKTTVPYLDYPESAKKLVPGTTYLWRVKGLLKGIIDATVESESYAFKYAQTVNPAVAATLQGVESILAIGDFGATFEGLKGDFSAGAVVRYGGKDLSPQEVKDLATKFTNGTYKVINVRVE